MRRYIALRIQKKAREMIEVSNLSPFPFNEAIPSVARPGSKGVGASSYQVNTHRMQEGNDVSSASFSSANWAPELYLVLWNMYMPKPALRLD